MASTVAAIATPLSAGAVGIVRLSGEEALKIASECFTTTLLPSFTHAEPYRMYLGKFNAEGFSDRCLAVYFKSPHSFTGEDVVEFQCHGGVRLMEEVLKSVISHGAVIADKGEFTKRAFLNGKFSLAQAEGVAEMIMSENIAALNAGYRMLKGNLSSQVRGMLDTILDLTASLEASLDYPDELEEEVKQLSTEVLGKLYIDVKTLLKSASKGRIVKSGINIAIVGAPNIGKSSLLNALLGKDRAIVTDIAGTTRDTLEERIEVNGVFLNFIDTAGIRQTSDYVEQLGIDKAYSSAENADIVLFMLDASGEMSNEDMALEARLKDKRVLKVYNKSDMGILPSNNDGIAISALNGTNIDLLLDKIVSYFMSGEVDTSGEILTNLRHIDAVERALDSIKSATYNVEDAPIECTLIDLHAAYSALGEITGDTASEDVIDRIFTKFCLGK